MRLAWSAVFALSVAGAAWAQDEAAASQRTLDEEAYQDLLERIRTLEEKQQETELDRLKRQAAKEKQEEIEGLPARVSKLEKGQASSGQTWDASKMLYFSTPDGNFTAKVGGRIYVVGVHRRDIDDDFGVAAGAPLVANNTGDARRDNFVVDTARISLDGTFFKDFYYKVEWEAAKNGAASNNDTYIGWQGLPFMKLQAGQFKVPFSQEETCSSRFIDFAERSLVNRLVPSRDQGVMVFGDFAEKTFEWAVGAFNGSGKNLPDTNDEFDVALRLFITPFRTGGPAFIKQLRIGADVTVGDQDGPAPQGDINPGDVFPDTLIDFNGTAVLDGLRTRYTLNFSWLYGPASIRAEYMVVNLELDDEPPAPQSPESEFEINAWYVQATFLLTGEDKILENRIKPANNFHPLEGKWGAFELAVRVANLDASEGEDAGIITVTTPPTNQELQQLTVGINWWWSPNVVWRINWERYNCDEDIPGLKTGEEPDDQIDVFYVRWQIDF